MKMIVLVLALSLGACASLPPELADDANELVAFTAADVRLALDDAQRHNDRVAVACWSAILPRIEGIPAFSEDNRRGAAYAFQRARDVRRILDARDDELHIACAPMVDDAKNTVLRLLRLARGVL